MDDWEDQEDALPLGDTPFFALAKLAHPQGASLETLSGERASDPPYATSMVARHERAWRKPLSSLTCEEVRLLVSQRFALPWLAGEVLDFLETRPDAYIQNYPGELSSLALRAASEMLTHQPERFRVWLAGDFTWAETAFSFSRSDRRDFYALLDEARALARH